MTTNKKGSVPATSAPAKSASKKTEKKEVAATAAATPVAAQAAPAQEKATKKASSTKKADEKVATPAPAVAQEATEATEKKGRRKVSKQSVVDDFSALLGKIDEEIKKRAPVSEEAATASATEGAAATASKKSKRKKDNGVPLKVLRTIAKKLEVLKNDASRMLKIPRKSTRDNSKSGLMKPVAISSALYTFLKNAGYEVEKNGQYPRVVITRYIHTYVKNNKLRKGDNNTEAEIKADKSLSDKRIILPDEKLAKLLGYDAKTATSPVTYFRIPQYLKAHFITEQK